VACVVQEKKDSEGDKNRKVDGEEEEKKNDKSGKKMGWKKIEKLFARWSSGESTQSPTKKALTA
jgi:hypothetical protein